MIDKSIETYIEEYTTGENPLLAKINRITHLRTFYPNMLSGKVQAKFLEMLVYLLKPKRILEIGTFTGYSALAMAAGLDEHGLLYTIENNEELERLILEFFENSPFGDKIKLLMGDALQLIPSLNETFDLVFLDANKEQYVDYYTLVFDKVKSGGFIIADNVLWGGKVMRSNKKPDKETLGIRRFNDFVKNDKRVEQVMLSVRDGLLLIRKIN